MEEGRREGGEGGRSCSEKWVGGESGEAREVQVGTARGQQPIASRYSSRGICPMGVGAASPLDEALP
eukprot:31079-Hanusia_phi.AAC.1